MPLIRRWSVVGLWVCALAAPSAASRADVDRAHVLRLLNQMIATGLPAESTHDEGEWLQGAVDDFLKRGDREIERLAVRAAAPLRVGISVPVSSADGPPSLSITASPVLKLRNAVPYVADVSVSLDGGPLVDVWRQASGTGGGFRIETRLGDAAIRPGAHHLRVRARLNFGDPREPLWTEVRDLPEVAYAIYDLSQRDIADARGLVFGPAWFAAADFDATLPREPLGVWLTNLLRGHGSTDVAAMWRSYYCGARTGDPHGAVDVTRVCAVLYFQAGARIGQIWFRTGEMQMQEDRIAWIPLAVPSFEAVVLGDATITRLSDLSTLLQSDPAYRMGGDVFVNGTDITLVRGRSGGTEASIVVRNRGQDDLHKVLVSVHYGPGAAAPHHRRFVVDVPRGDSTEIRMPVAFTASHGYIAVAAYQQSEHSPVAGGGPDPTPDDACAVRVFNAARAPAGFAAGFRQGARTSTCQVVIQ